MTRPLFRNQIPAQFINATRSALIATSVIGIILGVVALFWPRGTLLVIAVLFGLALVVTGVFRLVFAFSASLVPTGMRVLYGLLGALILVVGVICLFDPGESLTVLAIFIGVGWIFDGVYALTGVRTGYGHAPRWAVVLNGVVSILAGIVMLFLPGLAIPTFLWVAAIMLIAVSLATLFSLPRKIPEA